MLSSFRLKGLHKCVVISLTDNIHQIILNLFISVLAWGTICILIMSIIVKRHFFFLQNFFLIYFSYINCRKDFYHKNWIFDINPGLFLCLASFQEVEGIMAAPSSCSQNSLRSARSRTESFTMSWPTLQVCQGKVYPQNVINSTSKVLIYTISCSCVTSFYFLVHSLDANKVFFFVFVSVLWLISQLKKRNKYLNPYDIPSNSEGS